MASVIRTVNPCRNAGGWGLKHLHSLGLWPSCHGKQVASPLPSHPERDEIYVTLVSRAGQHASVGSLKYKGVVCSTEFVSCFAEVRLGQTRIFPSLPFCAVYKPRLNLDLTRKHTFSWVCPLQVNEGGSCGVAVRGERHSPAGIGDLGRAPQTPVHHAVPRYFQTRRA